MKKILYTIIIVLFTSTNISYAGLFDNQPEAGNSSGSTGGFFNNNTGYSGEATSDDYGGFFRSSEADDPGGRPGGGDGIGQEAPLGNGFFILSICCSIYGIIKLSSRKGSIIRYYIRS